MIQNYNTKQFYNTGIEYCNTIQYYNAIHYYNTTVFHTYILNKHVRHCKKKRRCFKNVMEGWRDGRRDGQAKMAKCRVACLRLKTELNYSPPKSFIKI